MPAFLRVFLCLLMSLFIYSLSQAQISGSIIDETGAPLAYVSIYEKGTTQGTVSNENGYYFLDILGEEAVIIYTYIGYQSKEVNVKKGETIDVVMVPTSYDIDQVTILANSEDPAYPIIRKAIEKREYYRKGINEYTANLYIKGNVEILTAPKKILGNDVGDMGGLIDSSGQGIIYLGESESKLYYKPPNKIKEVMYSSKVAESDGSFNPNTINGSYYNIYEEHFQFFRTLLNPLADNALLYYNYKLEGATITNEGKIVNKISVIPKSNARPLFHGTIYVYSEEWSVPEVDLFFTGSSVKSSLFDTINIQQVYIPVKEDKYLIFSQHLSFEGGIFGFKIGGVFNFIFSDYDLDTPIPGSIFNAETFKMEEGAAKNDTSFWSATRPIPLTTMEEVEYIRKDSLKKIWSSKSYKDSIDRISNKFKLVNVLSGYTYTNSYAKKIIRISSIIGGYQFNAVEGSSLGLNLDYTLYDSTEVKRYSTGGGLRYGLKDEKFKGNLHFSYRPNLMDLELWSISLGDEYRQYCNCGSAPVPPLYNTIGALIFDDNQLKLYRSRYMSLEFKREIINGIRVKPSITYQKRSGLTNYGNKYESNHPSNPNFSGTFIEPHKSFIIGLELLIRPFQKYETYLNSKSRSRSKWPDISIDYQKSIKVLGGETEFDRLKISVFDNYVNANIFGKSRYRIEAGTFIGDYDSFFLDYFHFISNEYLIADPSIYTYGFKRMPHYRYSTSNDYILGYIEHNFDGYILDYMPLINRLGWSVIGSASSLVVNDSNNYHEVSVGLDNIGFKTFRFLRVDYVWSYDSGLMDRGWVLGLNISIK